MKIINNSYASIEELEQKLNLADLDTNTTALQIFSGFVLKDEIAQIQSIITKKNSGIVYIGTTTSGEIFNGESRENTIVVSIMKFEHTTFTQGYFIDEDDFSMGEKVACSLFDDNTKAMILFIDGLLTNGSDVVDGIASVNCAIPVAGGLAGENGRLEKTYVFDRHGVYLKGLVALALNSDVLHVTTDYQLNWQAIGKTMIVTKADKNHLFEVDNINVSDIYGKYLGENIKNNLPYSATEFPLLKIEDDGTEVCRTFIRKFDDGSFLAAGNFEVGDKVRFSFGNINLIVEGAKKHIKHFCNLQPEALFIYSCVGRKVFLQSAVNMELKLLSEMAPGCGFFTYGEIFHKNKKNLLLNESITTLSLSEHEMQNTDLEPEAHRVLYDDFLSDKHLFVLDALTNLSNNVIKELEEEQARRIMVEHELRIAKEHAETASKDKSRFLAAASHDLRQPLYAMNLHMESLNTALNSNIQRELLSRVQQSGDALSGLLNALLDVSQLDAGVVVPHMYPMALSALLHELTAEWQPQAEAKGLTFRLRDCGRMVVVHSDPVLLARMLRNLLSNAVRHSRRGGMLFGCRRVGDHVRIGVWDTGPGIQPQEVEHIFSEFYQLKNPERDRNKGLGLGLAIVRRLSELLEHPVHVRSVPGHGSCFAVDVPQAEATGHTFATAPDWYQQALDMTGYFIVVVDDETDILDGMGNMLTGWGCEMLLAEDADTAIRELGKNGMRRPDVVVADYRLRGGHTGIEAVRRVREIFDDDIPAIIVTGDTAAEVVQKSSEASCMIMHKPAEPARLRSLLRYCMESGPGSGIDCKGQGQV